VPTARKPAPRTPALSRVARWRRHHPWFDHLARTVLRYVDNQGYHYAASITYFSVLSLVPLLMVGLSIAAFVLAGTPGLLEQVLAQLRTFAPGTLAGALDALVANVVNHRLKLGLLGLLVALYSGWNWMNALRDALTAMYRQPRPDLPVVRTVLKDTAALLGLAAALVVTFAFTLAGGDLGDELLKLVGLGGRGWSEVLLGALSVVLALTANWLVFAWVLAKLPRRPVPLRSAVTGAAAAAVGFELLKRVGNLYLEALGRSPTGVTFGSVVGLLVFVYLVSRLLMLASAWVATGAEAPAVPPGASEVTVATYRYRHALPSARTAAGLVGVGAVGALAGLLWLHRLFSRGDPVRSNQRKGQ
jgi:membrane protein